MLHTNMAVARKGSETGITYYRRNKYIWDLLHNARQQISAE
jgi:hypothetical protein